MTEVEIKSLARSYSRSMLAVLVGVARQKTAQPSARVAAANSVLERGWGKAPQAITGENGEGDIKITIRHILERVDDKPVVVNGESVRCIDADAAEAEEE
jgi:hypothetical protein